jgi:hypothetical protein
MTSASASLGRRSVVGQGLTIGEGQLLVPKGTSNGGPNLSESESPEFPGLPIGLMTRVARCAEPASTGQDPNDIS